MCSARSGKRRRPDIMFLSAFPAESEYLFPPLTYLRPEADVTGERKAPLTLNVMGKKITLINVIPRI